MTANGPSMENLRLYTQHQNYQQTSALPSYQVSDSVVINEKFDNFVRQIHQYDSVLSKVAQNMHELESGHNFIAEFYPEKVQRVLNFRYDENSQKKVIYPNEEMAKSVTNLEKTNSILKEQVKGWYFEYTKKAKLTQMMIEENKTIRKYVGKKNMQIIKLLECIRKAQNQQINGLNCQLGELKQENGVLLDHLNVIERQVMEGRNQQKRLTKIIQNKGTQMLTLNNQIKSIEDNYENIAATLVLNKSSQNELIKRQSFLLFQKNRLSRILQQLQNDQTILLTQIQVNQKDNTTLQNFYVSQYDLKKGIKQANMNETEDEVEKLQFRVKETRKQEEQRIRNGNKLQQLAKVNMNMDVRIKMQEQILNRKMKEITDLEDTQTTILSEIDLIKLSIDDLKQQLTTLKTSSLNQNQKHMEIKKQNDNRKNDEIKKYINQLQKTNRQANNRIIEQNNQIQINNKIIENYQQQINEKNQEIRQMMAEIQQFQYRQQNIRPNLKHY